MSEAVRMRRRRAGFALILTVALLALLVLAVYALSMLVRVDARIVTASSYQSRARQHALLGLQVALGELQRTAGPDQRITGMAGIAGVARGAASTTRYWCGVWEQDGTLVAWLTSGAALSPVLTGPSIELVSAGSVGAASSTSANVEKEPVIAGKIRIPGREAGEASGHYAFVVLDEGVKVSAYAPAAERIDAALAPEISGGMLLNQLKLKEAIAAHPAKLGTLLSYEQLALLPVPAAPLTPSVLQDTFHYVTLTTRSVVGNELRAGTINLNTASTLVWRCVLDLYNRTSGAVPIADVTTKGNALGNGFAASTAGKFANGPFVSVTAFEAYLSSPGMFPTTGSPTAAQILAALSPILAVRSDTFRLRAYGDAVNPVDGATESVAFCEAIVQRTPETVDAFFGRRFAVVSFRWLGADDI